MKLSSFAVFAFIPGRTVLAYEYNQMVRTKKGLDARTERQLQTGLDEEPVYLLDTAPQSTTKLHRSLRPELSAPSRVTSKSPNGSKSDKQSKSNKTSKSVKYDRFCNNELSLATGAVLSVNLDLTGVELLESFNEDSSSAMYTYDGNETFGFGGRLAKVMRKLQDDPSPVGRVAITKGTPGTNFAHFTYVVDTSGSTVDPCGGNTPAGTSVLQCEKDAIMNLNSKIATSDIAVDVGLVDFNTDARKLDIDDNGGTQYLAAPEDPGFNAAIVDLISNGWTSLDDGMTKALEVVQESLLNPAVSESIIVVVTDGTEGVDYNTGSHLALLQALGTKVFTFAIGSQSKCCQSMLDLGYYTGGSCKHVLEPSELEECLEKVFIKDRTIDMVFVTVNGDPVITSTDPPILDTGLSPSDSPAMVYATLELPVGSNDNVQEVCLEGFSLQDVASCCVKVRTTS